MGAATMSNNVYLPPRSIGGYTGDLIGARASCGFPVPRSFVNGYNYPWIHGCSSFGPSFRSNIPPQQSMQGNYTGANTSLNPESGLLGAELSYQTPYNNSMYAAFHYSSNAYPLSEYPEENDLIGAQISNHTAHPNYPTYVGDQPINTHPVATVGWVSREKIEFSERDLLGAQMTKHTARPNYGWASNKFSERDLLGAQITNHAARSNYRWASNKFSKRDLLGAQMTNHAARPNHPTYVGVQPINAHPVPKVGWASRFRNKFSERDLLGAHMTNHAARPNHPTYVGVQPINAHPVPRDGWVRNQLGRS